MARSMIQNLQASSPLDLHMNHGHFDQGIVEGLLMKLNPLMWQIEICLLRDEDE